MAGLTGSFAKTLGLEAHVALDMSVWPYMANKKPFHRLVCNGEVKFQTNTVSNVSAQQVDEVAF